MVIPPCNLPNRYLNADSLGIVATFYQRLMVRFIQFARNCSVSLLSVTGEGARRTKVGTIFFEKRPMTLNQRARLDLSDKLNVSCF